MTTSPTTAESTADPGDGNLHSDIFAAYLAAGARVASWVIVSAVVFRSSITDYAVLGVIRYTIAILNYSSLGLAPAMIRLLAEARSSKAADRAQLPEQSRVVYSNALLLAGLAAALGLLATVAFARYYDLFFRVPSQWTLQPKVQDAVLCMGIGTVLRLAGDAPGAWLQTHGQIARDNIFLAIGEAAWVALFIFSGQQDNDFGIDQAASTYALAALVPLALRISNAAWMSRVLLPNLFAIRARLLWFLLAAGGTVLLAQVADYLYAPIDYVLINHYLDPLVDSAAYTPMAQIGSALLLVSSGLAAVLLPRSAVAHAAGNIAAVRRYYVRGTLLSGAALAVVAAAIWLTLPTLLRLWLGKVIPQTVDVMPIMLLASVVGGSGMVGRSILIGTGKFGVFTASVLLAAVGNVVLSFLLVRYTRLGLAGVVLGTLVATAVRCVIWMPWYVRRMLTRQQHEE